VEFAFSEDQRMMQEAVGEMLANECSHEALATAWETETGQVEGLWSQMAELGILGLTTPESDGGLGLGPVDLVLLLEECGRYAVPEPVSDLVAVAGPLLAEVGGAVAKEWLPRMAAGDARVAVGLDVNPVVAHAAAADLFLLQRGEELHAVPASGVTLRAQESVDGGRRVDAVDWSPADATRIASGEAGRVALARAADRGAAAAAAELLGLGRQLIELTVEYAKGRVQFGQPIGAFQAVKHHLANAYTKLEFARAPVYHAAYAIQESGASDEAALAVSTAKALAGDAAHQCFRTALQCHGAIAYTYEYHAHMWMKRVLVLERQYGDARYHRRRASDLLALSA
jgi:alkylation response protein AidB-like acyl-CoA dehydrogenase